jgi:hypothetical protein
MRLPEVRKRLYALAKELRRLANETKRRKPLHRAKPRARKMTPNLRRQIRRFVAYNPDMSNRQIGRIFKVDGGRVSEAKRGFRK